MSERVRKVIAEMREQAAAETQGDAEAVAYARLMRTWADELSGSLESDGAAWQPIEAAPKDGTPVLVYYRQGGMTVRRRAKSGRWIDVLGNDAGLPEAWMPLPTPPDRSSGGQ